MADNRMQTRRHVRGIPWIRPLLLTLVWVPVIGTALVRLEGGDRVVVALLAVLPLCLTTALAIRSERVSETPLSVGGLQTKVAPAVQPVVSSDPSAIKPFGQRIVRFSSAA
jgi:hypothetical protein